MAQESNMDLAYFESLESKSVALSQQLTAHILKVQDQMQQVMSTSTIEHGLAYKLSLKNLCQELETSTKRSLELITHCDELDKDLSQLHELARQIKSVDKALDHLQKAIKIE
ncbi:hypothetical protein G6F46_003882 [Rhizopus delemar]|uniref:BLOC-1-related complex subunit 6 C-terminal helix domain-containing protein n=3 Tax=Rhizopus TaxID=4842 RepID=I1BNG1_RHIO9|nr:hypothetical protein RO3G_02445 [Rhizopus delemar RA 99-880]KAG1052803.1 hypothetical protein G6F43_005073 [Rhizopus delemar]KAG1547120.1 hypothetical protein G6F51_004458 [Rhizopus arrhizus]KAG1462193.1 hypothetical protein G6F55_003107 [Rhizopus delemar]KAG1500598.1 hypothetical protein G6F54_003604 [Rhizopus delemar]|eukprot:EIE77741.1 hypothetical protein RO3G_02445 [Rhizopus delemar RA 99-880]